MHHDQLTENADYNPTASPPSGTISSSNTWFSHTFEIINDTKIESPESFLMHIMITRTTPPSLSATANPDRATVRIIDDDSKHCCYFCAIRVIL